jgi:hypothetical protein
MYLSQIAPMTRPDWFDRLPNLKRWLVLGLALSLGIAIGWVWHPADDIGRIMGDAHWRITHEVRTTIPTQTAPDKFTPQPSPKPPA